MVTGSWDRSVRLWDPRAPCNAGTFTQPDRVCRLGILQVFPKSAPVCVTLDSLVLFKGVHHVCSGRPSDCRHGGQTRAGLGPEKHGLRPAEARVQSQVSDPLHPSLPQQAGVSQEKPSTRFVCSTRYFLQFKRMLRSTKSKPDLRPCSTCRQLFSSPAGLRLELHRGPRGRGVPGPERGGPEEEVRLQVPPAEGRRRASLPRQRHLLSQRAQHLCNGYVILVGSGQDLASKLTILFNE